LVIKELSGILEFLRIELKKGKVGIRNEKLVYFKILERKKKKYNEFQENIKKKWYTYESKNQKIPIKKITTSFLVENFNDLFNYFFDTFFGLGGNSLQLTSLDNLSDTNLILEYKYYLTPEEEDIFKEFSTKMECSVFGSLLLKVYMYFLVSVLGSIIKKTIDKSILISLDCMIIKEEKGKNYLNFLILIRDQKQEILDNYIKLNLFYFLKQFKGIPQEYFEKLFEGRDKIYQIALNEYDNTDKKRIDDLLFYFNKKCKLLHNFSPLFDFFNFVCSRVEDSVFKKIDIIKEDFLDDLNYNAEKNNAFIRIFNFLDKNSTLYSTFQANNLPSDKAQFNLFMFYMKYYFGSGSLESLEVGHILFLPETFKTELNEFNKVKGNKSIDSNSIKDIEKFIDFFTFFPRSKNVNLLFKKIFHKSISQMNYLFFRSLLKSFNESLLDLIESESKFISKNAHQDVFDIVIEHIDSMLNVIINKIFITDKPENASKNFIDPRGRYIGKNIALRVLELFIFQEINFSDDIWDEILISMNKDKVRKDLETIVEIPEKHFYSDKELTRLLVMYNFQSFSNVAYFEEWLITELILPLNNFILKIRNSVKDPSNTIEVYEILSELMLENLENKENLKNIKTFCQQIAPFWATIE